MFPNVQQRDGTLPRMIAYGAPVGVFAILFGWLYGQFYPLGLARSLSEVATVVAILISAGGWGGVLLQRLFPKNAPAGLKAATACLLGLWLWSVAMMVLGSTAGVLPRYVWWGVLLVGLPLAGYCARGNLRTWKFVKHYDGRALNWVFLAACIAIWMAGVMRPPGTTSLQGDAMDVLTYHLQLPREFLNLGRVTTLDHNMYSHFPLGTEMLAMIAMQIRNTPQEGMYLATLLCGSFGLVAVGAVLWTLRPTDDARGRFAAGLLASVPVLLMVSWMAFSELAMIAYLTVAVLWLREWLNTRSAAKPEAGSLSVEKEEEAKSLGGAPDTGWQAAILIGLCLGASCGMKYLSVGFIVAPVVCMMCLVGLKDPRRLSQAAIALLVAGACFAPWMVRNVVATGNPVFPLMTQTMGQGNLSDECDDRWRDGHGAAMRPPVPMMDGWKATPLPPKPTRVWTQYLASQLSGQGSLIIAAIALCAIFATRGSLAAFRWDLALLGIFAIQMLVWSAFTHGMPPRFMACAAVPVCLIAAGGLARLVRVRFSPFDKNRIPGQLEGWGKVPAIAIYAMAVAINLIVGCGLYIQATQRQSLPPVDAQQAMMLAPGTGLAQCILREEPDAKFLLVGDAAVFYYPDGTKYAVCFNEQPTDQLMREKKNLVESLRADGITHVIFNWREIWRLAYTYGLPATMTEGLYDQAKRGLPASTPVTRQLLAEGARPAKLPLAPPLAGKVVDTWVVNPYQLPKHFDTITILAIPPEGASGDWRPKEVTLPPLPNPTTQPTTQPTSQPATQPTSKPVTS